MDDILQLVVVARRCTAVVYGGDGDYGGLSHATPAPQARRGHYGDQNWAK